MPAGSEAGRPDGATGMPPLPYSFRPLGARVAVLALSAALVLVTTVIWFTFDASVRARFTLFQRGTLLVLGLGFLSIGWGIARCRVDAADRGLQVVNGFRTHAYEWNQVVRVSLRPGGPWAELDLSDGTTVSALGIQGSDGARAARQVRALRALLAERTRTERDS